MRATVLSTRSPVRAPAGPSFAAKLLERAVLWLEVRRQRRPLASLNDAMLRDIGISRADAEGEYRRHFWDLPQGWR
jgi:uncharacterized protein YjiS (DUF1127 family)